MIDGQLDAGATSVEGGLHVKLENDWLYLATAPAQGSGQDTFLLLSTLEATPVAAPWAKGGTVPAWSAFVGNEESNGWNGWFDAPAGSAVASGAVLEARIDLQAEFGGALPADVYVAALRYGSSDGGALAQQTPAGDGDASVTLDELFPVDVRTSSIPPSQRIDAVVLHAAAPNPFNPRTTVRFDLARQARIDLGLFDLRGRRVTTLRAGHADAGSHALTLDGRDLASGVYLVRLSALGQVRSQRVVLTK